LRTSKVAHPQMRQIAIMIYDIFAEKLPVVFEDIEVER
jgi:thymidylate synthase (FAD)